MTSDNHIGYPMATISYTGTVQWQPDPEPFGDVYAEQSVGSGHDPLIRYPGQWRVDPVLATTEPAFTALYYNTHRWYNPSWGRYTQSDPAGFLGGLNLFRYAFSNPFKYTDHTGLWGVGPGPCGSRPDCCDRDAVEASAVKVNQQLGRIARGEEPSGTFGGQLTMDFIVCPNEPEWFCPLPEPDDNFNPQIPTGMDDCVAFCACIHEYEHFTDTRPWNRSWDMNSAYFVNFYEEPAYDRQFDCLLSFLDGRALR